MGGPLDQIIPENISSSFSIPKLDYPQPKTDRYWMLEALRASLSGSGVSNPNPAVGCIIVDENGNEISRGATQAFPGLHAERVAFQKIQNTNQLKNATAYVTLEPCSHSGNQPPCVDLFLNSPINRIFIARLDPNPRVNGQGVSKLKEAGKQVQVGLYHAEASAWNFSFFAQQKLKRPVMILKWAQTLDGQLSDDSGQSQWITSPAARAYVHWLRQRYDSILVGAKTILADLPRLSVRDCTPSHPRDPLLLIFDPHGICLDATQEIQKNLKATTFNNNRPCIYLTTELAWKHNPHSWLFKESHITVLTRPDPDSLLLNLMPLLQQKEISEVLGRPLQSILVEGGAKTLKSFLLLEYADLIHAFLAPVITGGKWNRISLELPLKTAKRWELISSFSLGPDTVIEMASPNLFSSLPP
jgi:diaminohydroxyphosphoribosylaminopyrimidine deaminase/5-amino-6-(5-phosphoribosylamino)uracil reductase